MLAKKADMQREAILVVEDDFNICALVRTFLENAGYTVELYRKCLARERRGEGEWWPPGTFDKAV